MDFELSIAKSIILIPTLFHHFVLCMHVIYVNAEAVHVCI